MPANLTLVTDINGHSTLVPDPLTAAAVGAPNSVSQPTTNGNGIGHEGVLSKEKLEEIKSKLEAGRVEEGEKDDLLQLLLSHSLASSSTPSIPTPLTSLERTLHKITYSQLEKQALLLSSKLAKLSQPARTGALSGANGGGVTGGMNGGQYVVGWNMDEMEREREREKEREKEGEEREVKKLKVELRGVYRKLNDAHSQIQYLETSLKSFRSHLLTTSPLIATDIEIGPPSRRPTLGDAESEHLILAGKKLSHIRRINRVGLSSAILHQAKEIVEGKDMGEITSLEELEERAREAQRVLMSRAAAAGESETEQEEEEEEDGATHLLSTPKAKGRRVTGTGTGNRSAPQTPRTPRTPKTPNGKRRIIGGVTSTPGGGAGGGTPLFSSPGGGFDDLLMAAKTVFQPDEKEKEKGGERKRRKLADDFDRAPGPGPTTGSPGPSLPFSALDVLADQAFSASQEEGGDLSPPPVSQINRVIGGGGNRDISTSDAEEEVSEEEVSEEESSEGGEEVKVGGSGARKKEEKRTRSPYIKWTIEEDETLIKAVIAHGNRWDQVALCVPSRSYHQCRQRWLRGLRSGEAIPTALSQYITAAKNAVEQYERARKQARTNEEVQEGDEMEL